LTDAMYHYSNSKMEHLISQPEFIAVFK